MSALTQIKIDAEGLAHMLADSRWRVPKYQRAYKWEKKQVTDLFEDIDNAIQDGQSEYFVGSIVVRRMSDETPEIVDGQQRLATISILIAAIRDYFLLNQDDEEGAEIIQSKYLFTKDLGTRTVLAKLHLSATDHEFFRKRILEPPSEVRESLAPTHESHERLIEAQGIAREHVLKIVQNVRDPQRKLHERLSFLDEGTKVILVQVPDDQNAFTIFETLNDRGLTLAITDLLKTYLFGKSGDRIDDVQQEWTQMFTTVESATDEETVKDFIRHHWSSKYGLTRERELYGKIKDRVRGKQAAVDCAVALNKEARLFAALRNSSHEMWATYGTSTRQHVWAINLLGMERITPLLLAIIGEFSKQEVQKSFKSIVCWGVRILIGRAVAGALERAYSDTAMKIRAGKVKTARALFTELRDHIAGDAEFARAFSTAKAPKSALARYYLQVLERQASGQDEPEFVANPNEAEINLEHILPQNPSPNTWLQFDADARRAYTYRIGNLALLKASENTGSGNEEFAGKKAKFAASTLRCTKQIAKYKKWTPQTIDSRQRALGKLAVKAWPLK